MKGFLRLGLFLAFAGFLSAQDSAATKWSRTYGFANSSNALDVAQTDDGGYAFAGSYIGDDGTHTAWLTLLKPDGSVKWSKGYLGVDLYSPRGFDKTSDGGFVLCGFEITSATVLPWVMKVKGDGSVSWKKSYSNRGQDFVFSVKQTSDGGFVLGGSSTISDTESAAWVTKLDGSGNATWSKEYGSGALSGAAIVRQTPDGGVIVAGRTSTDTNTALWILKLDSAGTITWQKQYDDGLSVWGRDIQPTPDGGYIVVGSYKTSPNHYESWVLKLGSDGSIQWQQKFDGGPLSSISTASDGGYLLAAGAAEAWIAKLNADGTVAWQKMSSGHRALSIHETSDHGFVVAGYSIPENGGIGDAWVLKGPVDGSIGMNASVQSSVTNAAVSNTAATVTDRQVAVTDGTSVTPVDLNPTVTQQVP